MGYPFVATPEDGVEHRGGELADSATHPFAEGAGTEDRGRDIALGSGAGTHHLVDGEGLTRIDDVAVERVCQELDVVDPGLAAVVVGGESGDPLDLGKRWRLDQLQAGKGPDQEGSHLTPGHRRVRAEAIVVGWVAALGDAGRGQRLDVLFVDAGVRVREGA